MKSYLALSACLTALGFAALMASAAEKTAPTQVKVSYPGAEDYTDFKTDQFNREEDRVDMEKQFTDLITKTAQPLLAPDQQLVVTFKDIDLAGAFEPWRGSQMDHIRIMKDIYPPRMTLEFQLLDATGKVLAEGKRQLSDLAYQSQTLFPNSDSLRYDKELLKSWLRKEFARK